MVQTLRLGTKANYNIAAPGCSFHKYICSTVTLHVQQPKWLGHAHSISLRRRLQVAASIALLSTSFPAPGNGTRLLSCLNSRLRCSRETQTAETELWSSPHACEQGSSCNLISLLIGLGLSVNSYSLQGSGVRFKWAWPTRAHSVILSNDYSISIALGL